MRKFCLWYLTSCSLLILAGCTNTGNLDVERNCPIKDLLLDKNNYPPNSIFDTIDSPIADKPIESAGQSAYYQDSWTDQTVVKYSSTENAIAEYDKVREIVFDPDEVAGVWETPAMLNLDTLSADRHQIACGNVVSFGNRCFMIGQYEEYYVFFRADISGTGITHELFHDLVVKIDEEMSTCLGR